MLNEVLAELHFYFIETPDYNFLLFPLIVGCY